MTKGIPLKYGGVALVDDEDYDFLMQWEWEHHVQGYAYHQTGRGKAPLIMHRVIMASQPGVEVDHIDHNGINNQRGNLRHVDRPQQNANRRKPSNNTSGFKGVCFNKRDKKWQSSIQCRGKRHSLGLFDNAVDAAKAYDTAARKWFGEFACLNFA